LWVAFYLFSANDITVRLFEGYLFPKRLRIALIERQQKGWDKRNFTKLRKWRRINKSINERIDRGEEISENELARNAKYFLEAHEELAEIEIRSPMSADDLMPTRLGNVLRASEMYAYERYAIEEITIWPRLVSVLPGSIIRHIEEKNNHFMFLINSSFMVFVNAFFSFVFGFIGLPIILFPNFVRSLVGDTSKIFYIGYDFINPLGYLLISVLLSGFGYILYRIAVNVAEDFGMYVRASFDLYRVNLIRQLNWQPPKTLEEERELWRDITRFIIAAERLGEVKFPQFQHAQISELNSNDGVQKNQFGSEN